MSLIEQVFPIANGIIESIRVSDRRPIISGPPLTR